MLLFIIYTRNFIKRLSYDDKPMAWQDFERKARSSVGGDDE